MTDFLFCTGHYIIITRYYPAKNEHCEHWSSVAIQLSTAVVVINKIQKSRYAVILFYVYCVHATTYVVVT